MKHDLRTIVLAYLKREISHSEIKKIAWEITSAHEKGEFIEENILNAAWTIQHIADQEHWDHGITERDLKE